MKVASLPAAVVTDHGWVVIVGLTLLTVSSGTVAILYPSGPWTVQRNQAPFMALVACTRSVESFEPPEMETVFPSIILPLERVVHELPDASRNSHLNQRLKDPYVAVTESSIISPAFTVILVGGWDVMVGLVSFTVKIGRAHV